MLDEMFRLQETFESRFFNARSMSTKKREAWTKEFIMCSMDELSEILNWINWKHWKKTRKPVNVVELKYEIVDLMHFVLCLAIVWKMTPEEMFSMYLAKMGENNNRQKKGY